MTVNVETLEKLERKITLTLPVGTIQNEVDSRLKRLARTVKMDGFRPGKVPMTEIDYVPCYRSEAGTGNAMGFVYWKA